MTDRAREIAHKYVNDMEGVYCYRERHSHICDALTADIVAYGEEILASRITIKAVVPTTSAEVSDMIYETMADGDD